jgi:hypothetical protein
VPALSWTLSASTLLFLLRHTELLFRLCHSSSW